MKHLITILATGLLSGCLTLSGGDRDPPSPPKSLGELNSGYSYIPLDALSVEYEPCEPADPNDYNPILDELPDNSVRIATKRINGNMSGEFALLNIGQAGGRYRVVLDYVNADDTTIPFLISADADGVGNKRYRVQRLTEQERAIQSQSRSRSAQGGPVMYSIPIYVGVGLRLTADIEVYEGTVDLTSLHGIATSVEAGQATGSLVVQTLGITGKQVSNGLIFSSDLNDTTVQNAVLALGKIKSILYSDDAVVRPRVTGLYLPIADGSDQLVNLIVSELAREPIIWEHGQC